MSPRHDNMLRIVIVGPACCRRGCQVPGAARPSPLTLDGAKQQQVLLPGQLLKQDVKLRID